MENGARRIIQDHYCNMGRRFREGYHPPRIVTEIRATLKHVKDHRNVTLSLPEPLLRRFRVHAAERNQSMTALMTEAIRSLMEREEQAAGAKRRFLARIRNAPPRGTGGRIGWSREELHER